MRGSALLSEFSLAQMAPRSELRRSLRERIEELGAGLQVLAEGMLGDASTIDLVAVDKAGQLVLVLIGEEGEDLELVTRSLALRRWVRMRIPDWLQLAPQLGVKPDAGVRAILLCPSFHPDSVAASQSLDAGDVELMVYRCLRNGEMSAVLVEPLPIHWPGGTPRPSDERVEPAPFRSGLTDSDLNLSPRERREFD